MRITKPNIYNLMLQQRNAAIDGVLTVGIVNTLNEM